MSHCFWSLECILLFWFTSWDDIWWYSSPGILNMLIHTMTGPGTKAKGLTLLLVHECTHLQAIATMWHLLWVLKQRSPMIGVSEPIQNSFILVLAPSKFPTRISWTVLLWLAHLASPLSGLCRQAHVFRGVHYHWVLALSWNWIVSTEIFSSNLATSVDSFGILDTLYMENGSVLHDFQKISHSHLCWQQYIFRILSHQDGNIKVKQCRVSQNNLLPKAISLRHLFLSVESTAEHLFQSSLLFPQKARGA